MSRPFLLFCVAMLLVWGGCNSKTGPGAMGPAWSKYDLGGGRYFVEIEATHPFNSSIDFRFRDAGDTKLEEYVNLSVGEKTRLRIEDGQAACEQPISQAVAA